jgi:hypothetical protein
MARTARPFLAVALAALAAACAESSTGTQSSLDLTAAFNSTPLGFSAVNSSFSNSSDSTGYHPGGGGHRRDEHGPGGGSCMGGGLGGDFLGGDLGGGRPFDVRLSGTCSFAAGTGLVTCTSTTRDGLAVTKTYAFTTASGAVQQALDSLTDKVVAHVQVSGTATRRDSVTAVVSHTSDRTVTGLAKGSTQRTVNGTSSGTENLTGTSDKGAFTASRIVGDTTTALVIPVTTGQPSYPTAGTVVRSMRATVTFAGQSAETRTRREVITFNGTSTATIVITENGTSKTCTLPLPHGRPNCP